MICISDECLFANRFGVLSSRFYVIETEHPFIVGSGGSEPCVRCRVALYIYNDRVGIHAGVYKGTNNNVGFVLFLEIGESFCPGIRQVDRPVVRITVTARSLLGADFQLGHLRSYNDRRLRLDIASLCRRDFYHPFYFLLSRGSRGACE